MAAGLTNFGALTPLQKKMWSAYVISAGRDTSFFMGTNGFISSGLSDATKPIHLVDELTKAEGGDRCIMPLVLDLQEDGTVGDNELEGNEESMVADYVEIRVDQLRHGVKSRGKMSEQRTVIRFRAQAKDKLAYWHANKTDELGFLTASGVSYTRKLNGALRSTSSQLSAIAYAADVTAPSSNRIIYAGTATGTGSLTANDKMSWNVLVKALAEAKERRLKPIRMNGRDTYVVVMSTYQARDLRLDPDYRAIVAQAGGVGKANPLFNGAFATPEGLILFEHQKVYTTLGLTSGTDKWGSGNTVDGAHALLMGAQAIGYARIGESEWGESDNTDYGNKAGISYGCQTGWLKPQFNSIYDLDSNGLPTKQDFSLLGIRTAAAR